MNTKQEKIEHIKKSCKVGKIICRILMILCMVGTVAGIVGAILVGIGGDQIAKNGYSPLIRDGENMLSGEELGAKIDEALDDVGSESGVSFGGLLKTATTGQSPFFRLSILCILAACIAALCVLTFWLFGQIFDIVLKEESPFTESVMKRFRINFILLSVLIFLSLGLGAGLIAGFFFWCIYNIFDYGCVLQTESDETL